MKPHHCIFVSTIGVLLREDPEMLKVYFISAVKSFHSSVMGPPEIPPRDDAPPILPMVPPHEDMVPAATAPAVAIRLSRMNFLLSIGIQRYS